TLLPSYQRMLKQMDFDVHANTTKQYVQQGYRSDHQLLGCAPGRHLVASADDACRYKLCTVKADATAPLRGCSFRKLAQRNIVLDAVCEGPGHVCQIQAVMLGSD
ncbi:hypothetical protein PC114_g26732, partial [Phytophthora cactorum]